MEFWALIVAAIAALALALAGLSFGFRRLYRGLFRWRDRGLFRWRDREHALVAIQQWEVLRADEIAPVVVASARVVRVLATLLLVDT